MAVIIEQEGEYLKSSLVGLAISVISKIGAIGTVVEVGEDGVMVQFLPFTHGNKSLFHVPWDDAVFDDFSENVRRRYRWFMEQKVHEGIGWLEDSLLCFIPEGDDPTTHRVEYNKNSLFICPLSWVDSSATKSQVLQSSPNWTPNPEWEAKSHLAENTGDDHAEDQSEEDPALAHRMDDTGQNETTYQCKACQYAFHLPVPWVCAQCKVIMYPAFPLTNDITITEKPGEECLPPQVVNVMIQFILSSRYFLHGLEQSLEQEDGVGGTSNLAICWKNVLQTIGETESGPWLIENPFSCERMREDLFSTGASQVGSLLVELLTQDNFGFAHLEPTCRVLSLPPGRGTAGKQSVCTTTLNVADPNLFTQAPNCLIIRVERPGPGWHFHEILEPWENAPKSYRLQAVVLSKDNENGDIFLSAAAKRTRPNNNQASHWVWFDGGGQQCVGLPESFADWVEQPQITENVALLLYDLDEEQPPNFTGGGTRITRQPKQSSEPYWN